MCNTQAKKRGKLFRLNCGPILQTGKQLNVSEEKSDCALMVGYQGNWWDRSGRLSRWWLAQSGEWELSGDRWLAHLLHSLLGHLLLQQHQRSRENAGQSPREAGRRAGEMLTTLKPTVVTDSALIGLEGDGPRGVDGKPAPNNLLRLTNVTSKVFTCALFYNISLWVFSSFFNYLLKKLRHIRIQA